MISVIIRTNNEERWISPCLSSLFAQEYKDFEVIIVDNNSTDMTLKKAKDYDVRVISIKDYLPGKALNLGIAHSKGEFVCCLSGHCIPVNSKWLGNLLRNMDEDDVAGVYGRQEPMAYTSDLDKRDLLNIFGLDKRVQRKDSFFHNANSMIRRSVWEKVPFDETVMGIEDRVWAEEVLKRGYKIIYEPEASVYHYHGIYQEMDTERCLRTVKILEGLHTLNKGLIDAEKLNVVALIPVKGEVKWLGGRPLIDYTIERCKESRLIKRTIISTDNPEYVEIAKKAGVEAPFLRNKDLSWDYVDLERVLQFSLQEIEAIGIIPDILVILEITYPFRSKDLLDNMIDQLVREGLDSIIPARPEYRSFWMNKGNELVRLDEGFMPRGLKQPIYLGLVGLGCITHPVFVREGQRLGRKIGIYEVTDPYSCIEVRDEDGFEIASRLIGDWKGIG